MMADLTGWHVLILLAVVLIPVVVIAVVTVIVVLVLRRTNRPQPDSRDPGRPVQ